MAEEWAADLYIEKYDEFLRANDIWTIGYGPGWTEKEKLICEYDQYLCENVAYYSGAVNDEAIPTKVMFHYAQNALLERP